MASLITVRLNKGDSPNWGFRLQGGKDFGTPLVIQKVNGGSPAERAGLIAGDSVIKINNTDVFNLLHKDAQDVIVRSGFNFDMTIQRGGSTWKPSVVPTGTFAKPTPSINNISPVTKTSLAANKSENIGAIGTGHNLSAKPFSAQNGAVNGGPKLVNVQYNTPLKLYSEDSIAETLSAQTEVLSTGALGVNFKKNEKNYDATNSAVYRMLQEAENEPKTSPVGDEPDSGIVTAPNRGMAGLRHVEAPQTRPAPSTPQLPPGQNICTECERLIVGVFVRIKDKNLHVECFKCATCGTSLKNVGYYNINNKLYCDIHAKLAAINNSPGAGLIPVTSPPAKAPASAISSALSSHSLPTYSPLSPKSSGLAAPYQPEDVKENIVDVPSTPALPTLSAPSIISNINKQSNNSSSSNIYSNSTPLSFTNFISKAGSGYSAPKPFSSVSAPLSPRAAPLSPQSNLSRAPLSPVASAPAPSYSSYSPASSTGRFSSKPGGGLFKAGHCVTNITWPPPQEEPEVPTACPLFYPPPSQIEAEIKKKAKEKELKLENEEAENNFEVEQINSMSSSYNPYDTEEISGYTERRSVTECIDILSETLQTQRLVENVVQRTPAAASITEKDPACAMSNPDNICCQNPQSCDLKRPTQYTPNTVECQLSTKVDNAVPQRWESPMTYAARTVTPDPDTFAQIPTKKSSSTLASALAIAPVEPFNAVTTNPYLDPVPLPEFTEPYFPPYHPVISEEEVKDKKEKPKKPEPPKEESLFVKALKIAPERPFTPVGGAVSPAPPRKKPKDPTQKYFEDLPKPQNHLDMRTALTTAPERPYSPLVTESVGAKQAEKANPRRTSHDVDRSQLNRPLKPEILPDSFQINQKPPIPPGYYNPSVLCEQIEMTSEESKEEVASKEIKTIETTQVIGAPQSSSQLVVAQDESQSQVNNPCLPMFQGFSCSFQNKTDHSQFSIEISTTPPVPTPPPKPQTPVAYIATVESKPSSSYIQSKEIVTKEEKREAKSSQKQFQQIKQEVKQSSAIEKQTEEVIQVKPLPLTSSLRKPEGLPQYQKSLQASAEADLLLLERKAKAEARLEEMKKTQEVARQQNAPTVQIMTEQDIQTVQQKQFEQKQEQIRIQQVKIEQQKQEQFRMQQMQIEQQEQLRIQQQRAQQQAMAQSKPIITVQSGDTCSVQPPQINFQPVVDEKPQSGTFSPRPRAITPSMINKAPPVLPYYQSNLVAQFHRPLLSSILDPKSPGVSRSPSPCPGVERSVSPFPSAREMRPKSPAAGPPLNPLEHSRPLPTPEDSRRRLAKENLSTFIPEYKSQRDLVEQVKGMDFCQSRVESQYLGDAAAQQEYSSTSQFLSQTKSAPIVERSSQFSSTVSKSQHGDSAAQQSLYEQKRMQLQDLQRKDVQTAQTAQGLTTTSISEKAHQEHLEALRKAQSQSTEISSDGRTQVQRKKTVTEEFEHTHKEKEVQIAKQTVSTTTKHPFRDVRAPEVESPVPQAIRRTNPQRNVTTSIHQKEHRQTTQAIENTCEKSCKNTCQKTCQAQSQEESTQNQTKEAPQPPTRHVYAPGSLGPVKHVFPPGSSTKSSENVIRPSVPKPDVGVSGGRQAGGISVAPKRGRGVLNAASIGTRVPLCGHCHGQIRGPFITALGKIWCPQHFTCSTPSCRRPLQDLGFVEEGGQLYCEYCFEQYLAPPCSKCGAKIKGDCLKAIGKQFHPECFNCTYCGKLFGNNPFFLEDGSPYCEADWNELFTTKCFACGFPVEAGDRWVEALNNNYHSQCFNCTMCKKNLEGQSFFAKGGRPFCKNHAR